MNPTMARRSLTYYIELHRVTKLIQAERAHLHNMETLVGENKLKKKLVRAVSAECQRNISSCHFWALVPFLGTSAIGSSGLIWGTYLHVISYTFFTTLI